LIRTTGAVSIEGAVPAFLPLRLLSHFRHFLQRLSKIACHRFHHVRLFLLPVSITEVPDDVVDSHLGTKSWRHFTRNIAVTVWKYSISPVTNDQRGKMMDDMLRRRDADFDKKSDIKWNFTKFLISRDGKVLKRYEPTDKMSDIEADINKAI
jgi:hypothetical protein